MKLNNVSYPPGSRWHMAEVVRLVTAVKYSSVRVHRKVQLNRKQVKVDLQFIQNIPKEEKLKKNSGSIIILFHYKGSITTRNGTIPMKLQSLRHPSHRRLLKVIDLFRHNSKSHNCQHRTNIFSSLGSDRMSNNQKWATELEILRDHSPKSGRLFHSPETGRSTTPNFVFQIHPQLFE